MTKKHFEIIAEEVRDTDFTETEDKWDLAVRLSNKLAGENPRFNRHKFIKACLKPKEQNYVLG